MRPRYCRAPGQADAIGGGAGGRILVVALPLASWLLYIQLTVGWPEPGLGNLTWPVKGLIEKWCEALVSLQFEPNRWLAISTLLAHLALTGQLVFLIAHPQWGNRWWRTGILYGALMLCLGTAVWEGFPGAATRVLLPLSLAFNVLAVRRRAAVLWLVVGNLTVVNGVLTLWVVPNHPRELTAHWSWNCSYSGGDGPALV